MRPHPLIAGRRRFGVRRALPLMVAAAVLTSLGMGGWKVRDVRRENRRLAEEARTCRTEQAAFLSVLEAVAQER
ncbi:MAG: hypothetical protein ABR559_01030 [Gemmatimonadota bacterium]